MIDLLALFFSNCSTKCFSPGDKAMRSNKIVSYLTRLAISEDYLTGLCLVVGVLVGSPTSRQCNHLSKWKERDGDTVYPQGYWLSSSLSLKTISLDLQSPKTGRHHFRPSLILWSISLHPQLGNSTTPWWHTSQSHIWYTFNIFWKRTTPLPCVFAIRQYVALL